MGTTASVPKVGQVLRQKSYTKPEISKGYWLTVCHKFSEVVKNKQTTPHANEGWCRGEAGALLVTTSLKPFHMHWQKRTLYYLHSLGTPHHKIHVKTNARPTKIPRKMEETNIKPVFKNYPINHSSWLYAEDKCPSWRWAQTPKPKIIFKT